MANITVGVFYQHSNPFNFVSNIFYSYFACGWINEKNLSTLFEMKLNHEINWSWNQKTLISNLVYSWFKIKSTRRMILYDSVWDIFTPGACDQELSQNIYRSFTLGTNCHKKLWARVISKYLILHTCNFIKNSLHQRCSNCNFRNSFEFLEDIWKV